jgi:L-ribulokinase
MAAAVVRGIHPTISAAQEAMGSGFETEYTPISTNSKKYQKLYEQYSRLGEMIEKETLKK